MASGRRTGPCAACRADRPGGRGAGRGAWRRQRDGRGRRGRQRGGRGRRAGRRRPVAGHPGRGLRRGGRLDVSSCRRAGVGDRFRIECLAVLGSLTGWLAGSEGRRCRGEDPLPRQQAFGEARGTIGVGPDFLLIAMNDISK
eukprot:765777-Hanusia_phi.AAC.1